MRFRTTRSRSRRRRMKSPPTRNGSSQSSASTGPVAWQPVGPPPAGGASPSSCASFMPTMHSTGKPSRLKWSDICVDTESAMTPGQLRPPKVPWPHFQPQPRTGMGGEGASDAAEGGRPDTRALQLMGARSGFRGGRMWGYRTRGVT